MCFFLSVLTSCSTQSSSSLQNVDTHPKHAVQSERLQRLMNHINDLTFERMLTAPEIDGQRRIRTEEMTQTAGSLVNTVQQFPKLLPSLPISPDEKIVFLHLKHLIKIPGTDTSLSVGGYVKLDAIYNSQSTGGSGGSNQGGQWLLPSSIPVSDAGGEANQINFRARQSRF